MISLSRSFLKQQIANPTILVGATFVVQNGIKLIGTLVLTRLLVPEAYGIMGILTSVAFAVSMLTDVGLQAFMLRHKDIDTKYYRDAMWTIRFLRSLALATIFFVLAGPIASWLDKPQALAALRIFSLSFVLDGLVPISSITALSDGKIAHYCLVDILHTLIGLIVTLGLALIRPDIYTLVYSLLITSAIRVILFRLMLPDSFLVWQFDMTLVKQVLSFGRYIVASSAITLVIMQLDKIIMSRALDINSLGTYYLALNLAMIPQGLSGSIAVKSLYPLYARSWQIPNFDMRGLLYSSRKFIDFLYIGGCLAIFALSSVIISVMYDPRYAAANTYLQILIIGTAPYMANNAINEFLVSKGITSTTLSANVVRLTWLVTGVPLAILFLGPIEFLLAISLTEYFAYTFLAIRLKQLDLVMWRQEGMIALLLLICQLASFANYFAYGII